MATSRPLKLSASVLKRVRRNPSGQDTKGVCVVCGHSFRDCPHSWADTEKMYKAAEMAAILGIEVK